MVVTYDGSKIRFNINGSADSDVNSSGSIAVGVGGLRIGEDWCSHYHDGIIDEARVSSSACPVA